ncbi:MAG: heme biosynthesis HemY N-terminal domain-containing protein [Gammaproteobacteria bacterium]
MTRLFIFSLLAIVVALWVTLYLGFPSDPGYLLIAFGNYTFETSLFALLVALVVIYGLIRVLLFFLSWINPMRLVSAGKGLSRLGRSSSRSNTVEGLLYLTRGNWQSSLNLLKKGMNEKDATVINYLAAAYAAYQLGDRNSWVELLEKAEQRFPATHSTINYLKARLHFASGQLEQSLAVLEELKKHALNDRALLGLLKEVYVELDDWQNLEALLPNLEKNEILDKDDLELVRKRIFMEQLYALFHNGTGRVADNGEGMASVDDATARSTLEALQKKWKKAPSDYLKDEKIVTHYTDLLLKLNEGPLASKIIEDALSKHWNAALVNLYGQKDYGASDRQLLVAESWLKPNPSDSVLLLTLGRLSMRNQLWGKAREYYETSIKLAPSAEAYGELGRLLKHLGEEEAGETYLQSYNELLGADLPDLPMPAEEQITH